MAVFLVQNNTTGNGTATPTTGNLQRDAYGVDVGEAYSSFLRGDYNRCIILQKGAIGAYDDRLEAITRERAKGASGSTLRKLNDEENQLQYWKADNLKHIGDCYRLLSRNDDALIYHQKGLEIYRRWAFTGYHSTDLGECYQFAINILNKLNRPSEAQTLQQEYERYLHSR
jgi:hypothetical protein